MTSPDRTEATIAAIATPPGPAGIGIIRISGRQALAILQALFQRGHQQDRPPQSGPALFKSHRLYYGWIIEPGSQAPVDEVLAVYMRAPQTYTREDVVEIHCHGSYVILQNILELVLAAGARLADPGEFTKRAFLNGRLDLTQAEAVAELLQARTKVGLAMALAQLQGRLHARVMAIREALLAIRAVIEVAIDFPEEDADILSQAALPEKLAREVVEPLADLVARADQGKIFRTGVAIVILGRPNVGKSSLLNTLLREERAIVTAVPGTTRDTIEEFLNIKGIPARLVDTAGIRDSAEAVEELGIERSRAKAAEADLVLFMLDATEPLTIADHQLYASIKDNKGVNIVLVLNKMDIAPPAADPQQYGAAFPGEPLVAISAKNHSGIDLLESTIFQAITGGASLREAGDSCAPNLRQRAALAKALTAGHRATAGLAENLPADLLAIELQGMLDHLSDIVGETTTDDVLATIFEKFCIGK